MTPPVPLRRFHLVAAELSVAVSALLVLAVLAHSTNGLGHRIKGTVLLGAGMVLFLFAVARIRGWAAARGDGPARTLFQGLMYFGILAAAAILTLTLDFGNPAQRAGGVAAQLIAGAAGILACIRYIRSS